MGKIKINSNWNASTYNVDAQKAQQALVNAGYKLGKVDGRWGKRSQMAYDQYLKDRENNQSGGFLNGVKKAFMSMPSLSSSATGNTGFTDAMRMADENSKTVNKSFNEQIKDIPILSRVGATIVGGLDNLTAIAASKVLPGKDVDTSLLLAPFGNFKKFSTGEERNMVAYVQDMKKQLLGTDGPVTYDDFLAMKKKLGSTTQYLSTNGQNAKGKKVYKSIYNRMEPYQYPDGKTNDTSFLGGAVEDLKQTFRTPYRARVGNFSWLVDEKGDLHFVDDFHNDEKSSQTTQNRNLSDGSKKVREVWDDVSAGHKMKSTVSANTQRRWSTYKER